MKALGNELRFALLVSKVSVAKGDELAVSAQVSGGEKCERCWHYTDDIGSNEQHPTICARCADNLDGAGEQRHYA